jgi:hypothetical protein
MAMLSRGPMLCMFRAVVKINAAILSRMLLIEM